MRFRHTAISLACATLLAGGGDGGAVQSVSFAFPAGATVAIPLQVTTITLKATASFDGQRDKF